MTRIRWSADMDAFLRANYASMSAEEIRCQMSMDTVEQIHRRANRLGLRKPKEWIAQRARDRMASPSHPGRKTQFSPGLVPWNAGTKGLTGTQEACRATQFKPGRRPHTWVPIGTFRVVDGMLEQKYADQAGPPKNRWKAYSRIVWENEHGPVPSGWAVVFRPGMQTTDPALVTLDRLECISRFELMRRNSRHNLTPELNELVSLRAQLTRSINTKSKEQRK